MVRRDLRDDLRGVHAAEAHALTLVVGLLLSHNLVTHAVLAWLGMGLGLGLGLKVQGLGLGLGVGLGLGLGLG